MAVQLFRIVENGNICKTASKEAKNLDQKRVVEKEILET